MTDTAVFLDPLETPQAPGAERLGKFILGLVILWNLWQLRAEAAAVAYLNDSAMHESMVRFANQSLLNFHFPMTQWYPWLNLGSPQFLHYQGLGATLAGALGLIFQPNFVFRWSLYLLLVLWPIVVYKSARIMGLSRNAQIAATLISPWLISVPLVGYEQKAYIWIGYGVWAQLCASWTLPFAWAYTWRAIGDRRYAFRAVLFIALTVALHFETGYMAISAIVFLPFVVPSQLAKRIKNMLVVLIGALVASSWVTVPLLLNRQWAAINTAIAPTGLVRGYGARANLEWLVKGQLFDDHRTIFGVPFPIITIFVFVGIVAAIVNWKRDYLARALVLLFTAYFLISWGPTTWGPFIAVIPGHQDIYFRRFQMSVSMAGIFLAGYGIAWVASLIAPWPLKLSTRHESPTRMSALLSWISLRTSLIIAVMCVIIAAPLMYNYDQLNANDISNQRQYQSNMAPFIGPIVDFLRQANNGRVYAGTPINWGFNFRVGYVPVFEYLTSQDIDQVGFTLRTASLMEQPEAEFNENNPADYAMFGVRYLILPSGRDGTIYKAPMVTANLVMTEGPYKLWEIPSNSYFSVIVPSGSIDENKGTLAAQAPSVMNLPYYSHYVDPIVNWGVTTLNVTLPTQAFSAPVGRTLTYNFDLLHGQASGTFSLSRPANVVLSASFDPGWQASVDGHNVKTQMLAPALISVPVPAGVHTVSFHYQGFQYYLELGVFSLLGLWWARRKSRNASSALVTVQPWEQPTSIHAHGHAHGGIAHEHGEDEASTTPAASPVQDDDTEALIESDAPHDDPSATDLD